MATQSNGVKEITPLPYKYEGNQVVAGTTDGIFYRMYTQQGGTLELIPILTWRRSIPECADYLQWYMQSKSLYSERLIKTGVGAGIEVKLQVANKVEDAIRLVDLACESICKVQGAEDAVAVLRLAKVRCCQLSAAVITGQPEEAEDG